MILEIRLTNSLFLFWGLFAPSVWCDSPSVTTTSTPNPGYHVCFGEGSICHIANNFNEECRKEEEAHGNDKYWECLCTSGAKAIEEACNNCEDYYGIGDNSMNVTSFCSIKGYTLAPIPSSVISQQSKHNATRETTYRLKTAITTYVETFQGIPTEPLPSVATTVSLPLETGAAPHQRGHNGLVMKGLIMTGLMLAF